MLAAYSRCLAHAFRCQPAAAERVCDAVASCSTHQHHLLIDAGLGDGWMAAESAAAVASTSSSSSSSNVNSSQQPHLMRKKTSSSANLPTPTVVVVAELLM